MSTGAAIALVRAFVTANWDSGVAAVRQPNETFNPGRAPWIEIAFPGAHIGRGDIGAPDAPMWDELGAWMNHVYVPVGVGEAVATDIADAIWEMFRNQDIGGVQVYERYEGQSGPREPAGIDGAWWGVSFGISYRFLSVSS